MTTPLVVRSFVEANISKYSEHKMSRSRNTLPDDHYLWELILMHE